MLRTKKPKLLVVAAFAVAALGATPLANAGLGIPQGPSAQAAASVADLPPGPNVAVTSGHPQPAKRRRSSSHTHPPLAELGGRRVPE